MTYQDRFVTSAEQLTAEFQRNINAARARRDITPQARQIAIARAYTKARDGLTQLQAHDTEKYHQQRSRLERKLFGNTDHISGASAVSSRDARDRAAKYTNPDDAAAALGRAQRDGDADLARAIAAHAADNASTEVGSHTAWGAVVQRYADSRPALADAYKELTELHHPGHGMDFTYVLPKPREIGSMADHQVDQLARTDLTIHGGPEAA
jgi:hypothetical protein